MLSIYFKKNVVVLLIGFILGTFIAFLFKGCGPEPSLNNAAIVQAKEFKRKAETSELEYLQKITVLQTNNTSLEQELKITREQLQVVKNKTKSKEANIRKLIEPKSYPAKDLLNKVGSSSLATQIIPLPCDTLAEEVDRYIEDNIQKDSLFEAQRIIQDSIINVKDSMISLHVKKYDELKKVFTSSLVQQEKLIVENNLLQKKFKRQKFRKKLFAIGATILSGMAADYLIHQ